MLHNLKLLANKAKSLAFWGKSHAKTKIMICDFPVERIQHFSYLGYDVSYNYKNDIRTKLHPY
jgi:hypothetical protein